MTWAIRPILRTASRRLPRPADPAAPTASDIQGTSGQDKLVGTANADSIKGLGGADMIAGRRGADDITGTRAPT